MKSIGGKKLSKQFGDFLAVNSVTFKLLSGKITGFLGPNGAGKTTLFHLISGDLKPDFGEIFLFDEEKGIRHNITTVPRYLLARRGIGNLYQDIKIFDNLSIIDNVIVALYNEQEENPLWIFSHLKKMGNLREKYETKAIEKLKLVGIYEDLKDDIYKKKSKELSFGQQKLLSFARLMVKDFDIILLDEPTAGVNEFLVKKIMNFIKKLVEEGRKTVGIIEHNINVLEKISDFIYFMEDGKIVFSGRADHIINNIEVRQKYIGLE